MPTIFPSLRQVLVVLVLVNCSAAASEPWATCPAWLGEPLIDVPPVAIADAPYPVEPGELPDPLVAGDQLETMGDPREALLRIARQPLEIDNVQVAIRRGPKRLTLIVDRNHLTRHLRFLSWSAHGSKRLVPLGVAGDQASLDRLPARVVAHLVIGGSAPWVARLAATWLAVESGTPLPPAGEPVPDPFLAQCEKLWRSAGADGDAQPDPWAWGIEPEFAALYLPYPGAASPALGELKLTDQEFVATLRHALSVSPAASLAERQALATQRTTVGAGPDGYIGQVQAAVLDPERHGGWPYRSGLILQPMARNHMLSQLRARRAAGGPDRPLVDLALLAPLALDHADEDVFAVLSELHTDSPLLACLGANILETMVGANKNLQGLAGRLTKLAADTPTITGPPHRALYRLVLARQPHLAHLRTFPTYDQTCGHPAALRSDPAAVAEALATWWDVRRAGEREVTQLLARLNQVAWWVAVDPRCIDRTAAVDLATQIRHLRGRNLPGYIADTVAACLARGRDFSTAKSFQRLAISKGDHDQQSYLDRLAAYEQEITYTETAELTLKPLRLTQETWPSGTLKAAGRRETDGQQRFGHWRICDETGALSEEQAWRENHQLGWTRRFFPDGTVREEGAYVDGMKVGRWRTYDAHGVRRQESWWLGTEGASQTGWAEIWHADQGLAEAGPWLGGRQHGFWQAWRQGGASASAGRYVEGDASGTWRTWAADGAMTERKLTPGATGAGDLF